MSVAKATKVLLIERDQAKAKVVLEALDCSSYDVKHLSCIGISLLKEIDHAEPDLILMDVESPSRDVIENLNYISQLNPKPVVMFSEDEDQSTISELVKSGVSAYVIGDVNAERVRSVINVAIARFQEFQQLKNELKQTKNLLNGQKIINKAKTWLMAKKQLSEEQAYHRMRKMAMDNGQKMEEVAKNILSIASVLED